MTTPAAPTAPTLYERLVELFGNHDVHPDDKDQILEAFDMADKFENLPPEIQHKIQQLEEDLPRQRWEDPADVPENLEQL